MSDDNKCIQERLDALWDRVEALEDTIERALAVMDDPEPDVVHGLEILYAGVMQTFDSALLCDRNTTDEQIAHWAPAATYEHAAAQGAALAGGGS